MGRIKCFGRAEGTGIEARFAGILSTSPAAAPAFHLAAGLRGQCSYVRHLSPFDFTCYKKGRA